MLEPTFSTPRPLEQTVFCDGKEYHTASLAEAASILTDLLNIHWNLEKKKQEGTCHNNSLLPYDCHLGTGEAHFLLSPSIKNLNI